MDRSLDIEADLNLELYMCNSIEVAKNQIINGIRSALGSDPST